MGGTFDPVHLAHLRLALEAIEGLKLEKVRWIPSGAPGHRETPHASAAERLEMLRLACGEEPRFEIDTADLLDSAPTFTINTLKRLRIELGTERPLVMLIGMDSLLGLHTWREWLSLFDLAHFAVAQRPGYELKEDALDPSFRAVYRERQAGAAALTKPHGHIVHFDSPALAISSSDIRTRIGQGRSARYLVPEKVARFIETQGLYH